MRFIFTVLCLLNVLYGQQTGVGKRTAIASSSIVDITNVNSKALALPQLPLTSYFNSVSPVNAPAEYLVGYNTTSNSELIKGLVSFQNGSWSNLAATKSMLVENAIIKSPSKIDNFYSPSSRSYDYVGGGNWTIGSVVNGYTTGTFKTINGGASIYSKIDPLVFNYNSLTGTMVLPRGNYVIEMTLNLATNESVEVIYVPDNDGTFDNLSSNLIGTSNSDKRTHYHQYQAAVYNSLTNTAISSVESISALSNTISTTSEAQRHLVRFSFSFSLNSITTVDLRMAKTGGTYLVTGSGININLNGAKIVSGVNNSTSTVTPRKYEAGQVDIADYFIYIQRSSMDL